jgi:hypothetical protein
MNAAIKEMDRVFEVLETENPNGYALCLATMGDTIRNDQKSHAEELALWIDFSREESHDLLSQMAEKGWYMCLEKSAKYLKNVNYDELIQTATNNATEEELQRSIKAHMEDTEETTAEKHHSPEEIKQALLQRFIDICEDCILD